MEIQSRDLSPIPSFIEEAVNAEKLEFDPNVKGRLTGPALEESKTHGQNIGTTSTSISIELEKITDTQKPDLAFKQQQDLVNSVAQN